ncbi:MAG: SRPBCC domain-containing protein [Candidatus Marinimicrobia bacterium]|jgi:uncharacterized protein YndB with AHSA1/START domain|nr:SRPBCC domain-containing protein [Candidatus Neomarinimicrobiota bacterium]MBT3676575.1 SRPBCC domain-containing protein [Candidatus Neomarinimicrobiota bacterium]MBT3763303.1 SRPBCC domain-containing protein [Candidatus Neomarinimicrobiota bacterium]MBT4067305.1 SRPBCC domain-containing protein [Candidatus Neomarinimicrobiota bacterium]MBT4270595.1 SRPBCC domain-containing protein [Candidatus Neomarinimicrobiota bacterium]
MPDILHNLTIESSIENVYRAVAFPKGLNAWWTKSSAGHPELGAEYKLYFSDEYDWRAIALENEENAKFVLEITLADGDWTGTKVRFFLTENNDATELCFEHTGWRETNDHFRVSSYCWAKYLRLLKEYVEEGIIIPFEER